MPPIIESEICIACGNCVKYCAEDVFFGSQEKQIPVISYPEENMKQSGWLIGEKYLARKAALIEAKKKDGKVIMYGFSPQSRALTDATFKFFFNALLQ